MKYKILFFLLALIAVFLYSQRKLVIYGLQQASGQAKILIEAKPIETYLTDPDYPDSLKTKLEQIQRIKKYAEDSLGIKKSKNYTKMFDQHGDPIMFVLTACEPFELKAKEWSFPFIGKFSYKGFFNLNEAKKERKQLQQQGLDTNIRTAGAWSTLGWFNDPILSNMLDYKTGRLAELIIHELTHGTIFVKDSVQFNENLATFIGHKGAVKYLKTYYGDTSRAYINYINGWHDSHKFDAYVLHGAKKMDSLYQSMQQQSLSIEQKEQLKTQAIEQIIHNLDTVSFHENSRYPHYFDKYTPNNTFFMAYLRYNANYSLLEKDFKEKYNQNIKEYINDLKKKYPSL
ncbi:aminopeptidase [Aureibacter tunicatorum]|uniref:Aminopeptidase n=1 Tax=Aureibacter tunicatorum TaxID=866807 RepID=A0AAE3XQI8_9BACT|nr:aminopeptidase [Aureibacter tunicatorum]MDR6240194.1 putative aminopeptidase [Aureibacter tunicatorum]BDD05925.1 aminopeptidase [Aureibacter tunicatorum]